MSISHYFLVFFKHSLHPEDSEVCKNFKNKVLSLVYIHYSHDSSEFPIFVFSLGVSELGYGMALDSEASDCELSSSRTISSGFGGGGQKSSLGQICWKSVSAWYGMKGENNWISI